MRNVQRKSEMDGFAGYDRSFKPQLRRKRREFLIQGRKWEYLQPQVKPKRRSGQRPCQNKLKPYELRSTPQVDQSHLKTSRSSSKGPIRIKCGIFSKHSHPSVMRGSWMGARLWHNDGG